jgi:hypothetical protein
MRDSSPGMGRMAVLSVALLLFAATWKSDQDSAPHDRRLARSLRRPAVVVPSPPVAAMTPVACSVEIPARLTAGLRVRNLSRTLPDCGRLLAQPRVVIAVAATSAGPAKQLDLRRRRDLGPFSKLHRVAESRPVEELTSLEGFRVE